MEINKEDQRVIQIQKPEERIEIKGKLLPKDFMVSMPCTSVDYNIICEVLNPEFLYEEIKEYGGKDYAGGICYGLNSHVTS